MPQHLEPTYLRYIYDGLVKGSVHSENAADLPDGLIGLYEEAFDERRPVLERQKLLKRFAIWALLKKEVSTTFVAELLDEPEEEIQVFISTYSSWFNSPESGKYQLYHERLKVYLLQKLSEKEVQVLHEILIARLEQAIEEQKADEFEWYGLEFMSAHLSVEAMLTSQGNELLGFVYSQDIWERQLKMSRGYIWTKNGLKEVMAWASKYNNDEIIECGLQMVDLHHQEQNASPQIVALVAEGDFDSALKCIEQFGGNDEEGLQRKFILYMLCLMELTLLESKDKPFRREGIEKLLKHLDEQLPVDHSVLNWNDFFSSYLMFRMACELEELKTNYSILYQRTDNWKKGWIREKEPLTDFQLEVLLKCISFIFDSSKKEKALIFIAAQLTKKEKLGEALKCARGIVPEYLKTIALAVISTELNNHNKKNGAKKIMEEAIECIIGIDDEFEIITALSHVSEELIKQKKLKEAINFIDNIKGEDEKNELLLRIASALAKQGKVDEALACARSIPDKSSLCIAISTISTELYRQEKAERSSSLLQEALENAKDISDEYLQSFTLSKVASEFAKQGKIKEAAKCDQSITHVYWENSALSEISIEIAKQGRLREALEYSRRIIKNQFRRGLTISLIASSLAEERKEREVAFILQEHISYAKGIDAEWTMVTSLSSAASELAERGKLLEALHLARLINHEYIKSRTLSEISLKLTKQEKVEANTVMQEAIESVQDINSEIWKDFAIKELSVDLAKQGRLEECKIYALNIPKKTSRSSAFSEISVELANQGKIELAVTFALNISEETDKINFHLAIAHELVKQGKETEALQNIDQSLENARKINNLIERINALLNISNELAKLKLGTDSILVIMEALEYTNSVSNESEKSDALGKISISYAKQSHWALAEEISLKIPNIVEKHNCWQLLARMISKQVGNRQSLMSYQKLDSKEAHAFYLKGWVENLKVNSTNKEITIIALPYLKEDIKSIEYLLQLYALNQLFFENLSEEKIQRFNRTLNLQWAIDIKNQLPN